MTVEDLSASWTHVSHDRDEIPIVDFSLWHNGTPEQRLRISKSLALACKEVGFVQITNHGLSPSLIAEAFIWSRKFFDLPSADKMKAPHPDGAAVHRGYSYPGLEKVSQAMNEKADSAVVQALRQVQDYKESYEIGSDDNAEQPNQWLPAPLLPGFRPFMTSFYARCSDLSREILSALALGIDLPSPALLLSGHTGLNNQLRLLHYPPLAAALLEEDKVTRIPGHSDWSSVTLLFQDDCGGLEVEHSRRPGYFVPVPPVCNALVLNIGDLLMRWSNDVLRSTVHRVGLPPGEDRYSGVERTVRGRYSIPFFVAPDPDTVVECLESCVGEDGVGKYGRITQREYGRMRAMAHYEEKPQDKVEEKEREGMGEVTKPRSMSESDW